MSKRIGIFFHLIKCVAKFISKNFERIYFPPSGVSDCQLSHTPPGFGRSQARERKNAKPLF